MLCGELDGAEVEGIGVDFCGVNALNERCLAATDSNSLGDQSRKTRAMPKYDEQSFFD